MKTIDGKMHRSKLVNTNVQFIVTLSISTIITKLVMMRQTMRKFEHLAASENKSMLQIGSAHILHV